MELTTALVFAFAIVNGVTSSSFSKFTSKNILKTGADILRLSMLTSVIAIVTFGIIGSVSTGLRVPSAFTVLMAIMYGVVLTCFSLISYRAMAISPLAYTSLFSACGGLALPIFMGAVWFHEKVDVFQVIGVALMLCMFFLIANPKKSDNLTAKGLLFCLGMFFFNGMFGVVQKLYNNFSNGQQQMSEFLMIAFAVYAVISFIASVGTEKSFKKAFDYNPRVFKFAIVIAVTTALNHEIMLYLTGVLPSILVFPIANGSSSILCTLISATFFKEKYKPKQYVGLALGICSVLLLSGVMNNFIKT